MKRKTAIGLILALLMIASTFSVIGATEKKGIIPIICEQIDTEKKIWDGQEWVDYYEAELNEIITFNITITYNQVCPDGEYATDIVVIDELPDKLSYISSTPYDKSYIEGNLIYWNLTEDHDINLSDGESVSIEFNAEAIDYGYSNNFAEVFACDYGCGIDLYGYDFALVYVPYPPSLEFEKEVYDPASGEWVETLTGVSIGTDVKFRLVTTFNGYDGIDYMNNMLVEDYLPECGLEYINGSEVFTYPSGSSIEDPNITVSSDLKYIIYDWQDKIFELYPGESITIEFEAEVVEYCSGIVENYAEVDIWFESECELWADDTAYVDLTPPASSFEKKVKDTDTGEWVEETFQYVGENVTFKLELVYYGNYNLTDVKLVDYLPDVTEYAGNANIDPTYISGDGKTIWWNLTEPVEAGIPLIITFDALVIGRDVDLANNDDNINLAEVTAIESVTQNPFEEDDTATITYGYQEEPELMYAPDNIDFGEQQQGWTGEETFEIWNNGFGTLEYTIYEDIDWIEIDPSSGNSTGEHDTINVSVINTEQMSGEYSGTITIESNGGGGSVAVKIFIEGPGPGLSYEPKIINFGEHEQGWTGEETFEIWNSGAGLLEYEISEEIDWIDVYPLSGDSTGEHDTINVSVINTEEMSGEYSGSIFIVSNGGSGVISVYIDIKGPGEEASITFSIPRRIFLGKVGVDITNNGEEELTDIDWEITITGGLLKTLYKSDNSTYQGPLQPGESFRVWTGKSFGKTAAKFKFGKIQVNVKAQISEDQIYEKTFNGRIIGRIIFFRNK